MAPRYTPATRRDQLLAARTGPKAEERRRQQERADFNRALSSHGPTKRCKSCGYAYTGKKCTNPACKTVNPQAHARHAAEARKRRAEQAERDRIAAIRRRHGGY